MRPSRALPAAILGLWLAATVLALMPLALGLAAPQTITGAPTGGTDPARLARLSLNSLKVAMTCATAATALGVLVALLEWLGCGARRGALPPWALAIIATPLLIPPGIAAVSAVQLFGANGLLTRFIVGTVDVFAVPESLTPAGASLAPAPIYTFTGAGLVLAACYAPIVWLVVRASLHRVSPALIDDARLSGGTRALLLGVLLPQSAVPALAGFGLVFLLGLVEFSVPDSLRALPVLTGEVFNQFGVFYDTRAALLASLWMVALALAAGACIAPVLWRCADTLHAPLDQETPHQHATPWGAAPAVLAILLAAVPTILLLGGLVATLRDERGPLRLLLESLDLARPELTRSLALSLQSSALAGIAGGALGWALHRLRRPAVWGLVLAGAIVVPGPVWGVGIGSALRLPPGSLPFGADDLLAAWAGTDGPLIAAWVLRFSFIVALATFLGLRRIPAELHDLAQIDGAGPIARAHAFVLRLCLPYWIVGTVLVFALTVADPGPAILLLPPGDTTVGVRLLTLMHFAPQSEVSALCLLSLAMSLGAGGLLAFFGSVPRRSG